MNIISKVLSTRTARTLLYYPRVGDASAGSGLGLFSLALGLKLSGPSETSPWSQEESPIPTWQNATAFQRK